MDAEGWLTHLAPDVVMQFANEDPVYGRDACAKRAEALFESVRTIFRNGPRSLITDYRVYMDPTPIRP